MRLVDCTSEPLSLKDFGGKAIPPFAILSHTWETEEVTHQDFLANAHEALTGWNKVQQACNMAIQHNLNYIWIDTCCIDKSSSAELTEAINSMFQWYNQAVICFAYLSDYDADEAGLDALHQARWFTRGWTLQELIAPVEVRFYNRNWEFIGTRAALSQNICSITRIDMDILCPPRGISIQDLLDTLPVAKRMSWASQRETTREEDVAYSLFGIFSVNMPLIYGEGMRAFTRLQEEILRHNNDLSLFAWRSREKDYRSRELRISEPPYRGILAIAPREFTEANDIILDTPTRFNPEFSMSNKGLRINTFLRSTDIGLMEVMPLHCHYKTNNSKTLAVFLKHQGESAYARAYPQALHEMDSRLVFPTRRTQDIFIDTHIRTSATRALHTIHRHGFSFVFSFPGDRYKLVNSEPNRLWDENNALFITAGLQEFVGFHHFQGIKVFKEWAATNLECVVACGFQQEGEPWLCIGPQGSALCKAALSGNLRLVAQIGQKEGSLKSEGKQVSQQHRQGWICTFTQLRVLRGEPVIFAHISVANTIFKSHLAAVKKSD